MDRRRFLGVTGALAAVVGAGCIRAPGASAQASYPGYTWGRLDRVDALPSPEIFMRSNSFIPLVTAVHPGTDVVFVNLDDTAHTVTIPMLDVDETVPPDTDTVVTFETEGVYDYVCTFHPPDMLGRVFVIDAPLRR